MSFGAFIAAPFGVWFWGIHFVSPEWSLASTLAVAATTWVVATLWLLVIKPAAKWAFIAMLIWATVAAIFFAPSGQRSVCGAHAIKRDSELRALIQAGANERAKTGTLPPSFVVLAAENGLWNGWSPRPCKCDGPSDLIVGRYSLQEFADGKVTLEELRAEAAKSPPGELERLGNVTIWRNDKAWDVGAIIAWRTPDDPRWDWASCGTSQLVIRQFMHDDVEALRETIAEAEAQGVSHPKELLELIAKPAR
ncbi:MAG: hypothetical protein ACKVZJ_04960 [Phycisphaerales bacterium]